MSNSLQKTIPRSAPPITRLALYVRDIQKIGDFYSQHFGFIQDASEMPHLLRLTPPGGGCALALLQASKGHKIGQSCIKIVFDVEDIAAFKKNCLKAGLKFGPTHECDDYAYSNARDPARNLIQISNSSFRK
jgi:predicted enzyme related to lactoylglutathione lyase